MTFRNAGEECLRIKYFARHNEIAYSRFHDCGIWDFVFDAHGVVGEAIYLGTSSKQWDINLTIEPDITAHNWVHHNVIDTQGNECVEAKEGSAYNIIEYNLCTGQKDPNSGGIVSRGKGNVIRFNVIHGASAPAFAWAAIWSTAFNTAWRTRSTAISSTRTMPAASRCWWLTRL